MEGNEKLPTGWIRVKSKSRPDKSYFYNAKSKISVWRMTDLKDQQACSQDIPSKVSSTPKRPPKKSPVKQNAHGLSVQSKNIRKNIARDRMTRLKNGFANELKPGNEKEFNNVIKTMRTVVEKNIAAKRMKNLKKELVVQEIPELRREETITTTELEKADMMDISYEDQIEDYEAMDWEEIPEQKIIDEVQKVRKMEAKLTTNLLSSQSKIKDDFHIVVDTNVLLSNLDFVKEIKGKMFKGNDQIVQLKLDYLTICFVDIGKATIFLPYIVLCELDRIKSHNDNLARRARMAINFLADCFKTKDVFIMGESALESSTNKIIPVTTGDDQILNCCLKMFETTRKLLLLTNDKNLRNKAFVNKIESFSRDMLNSTDFNAKNEIIFEV